MSKNKNINVTCPICKRLTTWHENPFRPFCSERCKLIDLGEWASENYKIAGDKKEETSDDEREKNET